MVFGSVKERFGLWGDGGKLGEDRSGWWLYGEGTVEV